MRKTDQEGESHFHRFKDMMKEILSVPKTEIDKCDAEWKKERLKLKRKRAQR